MPIMSNGYGTVQSAPAALLFVNRAIAAERLNESAPFIWRANFGSVSACRYRANMKPLLA